MKKQMREFVKKLLDLSGKDACLDFEYVENGKEPFIKIKITSFVDDRKFKKFYMISYSQNNDKFSFDGEKFKTIEEVINAFGESYKNYCQYNLKYHQKITNFFIDQLEGE